MWAGPTDLPPSPLPKKRLLIAEQVDVCEMLEDIEKWCQQCDTCAALRDPQTRNQSQMHQDIVGLNSEGIAIDVACPSHRAAKETDNS
jgi:hypothetical protein